MELKTLVVYNNPCVLADLHWRDWNLCCDKCKRAPMAHPPCTANKLEAAECSLNGEHHVQLQD